MASASRESVFGVQTSTAANRVVALPAQDRTPCHGLARKPCQKADAHQIDCFERSFDTHLVSEPPRLIAVWCPDWPVTTARVEAGLPIDAPIAVVTANRVVVCSHAAREHGVRRGLRRREAQARCPQLV